MLQISANQAFKDANNIVIGEPLNHITLNRNSNVLKKELNHTYNVTMASVQELCLPWVSTENYLIGELVSYDGVNYLSLTDNTNITPVVGIDWIIYVPTIIASKLSTPRQINGAEFDGTADITTTQWGTERTLTMGSSAKSVDGSIDVSWTADEMNVTAKTSTTGSCILPVGTTAQRDASPVKGYLRFNTSFDMFEGYNGITWESVGADFSGFQTNMPLISANTSGNENSVEEVVIDNYDATVNYNIVVSGGSTTQTGNIIYWTLPNVTVDESHTLDIFASKLGEVKSYTNNITMQVIYVPVVDPILSGPSSGNENTTIQIVIDNYDAGNAYNVVVSGGSFIITGANIDWTLPDLIETVNHTIGVQATNIDGSSGNIEHIVNVIVVPVATPILSGTSSANENTTIQITIDNYDISGTYNITLSGGSFVKNTSSIAWTLPEVNIDTNHTISVSFTGTQGTSSVANKIVNVKNIPLSADSVLSASDYAAIVDYNDGYDYL